MTKFLNISTDSTLAGNSDETVVSEKAIKAYADTKLKSGDNVSELANDAGYLVMGDLTGFVTRTTAQTISGLKTFTADIVLSGTTSIKNTTSGVSYTMLYRDTSGIHVGTSTQALLLAGSGTRPTFNGNNVAMSADIPTVNNPTITITQGGVTKGSFSLNQATGETIALDAGGGGGSVDIDNLTITENASQEIQAVAVIDQNTGIAKTWTGTQAEYDAIVTKDPETEYIITDDIGGPATVIAELAEAVNSKVDVGHEVIAFQAPTAQNNYTWYRKYADGWVEQGGSGDLGSVSSSPVITVSFSVEMANTFYAISIANIRGDGGNFKMTQGVQTFSTTGMKIGFYAGNDGCRYYSWKVEGMAA